MSFFIHNFLRTAWFAGVLTLLNTTIVQAVTPTCGTLLAIDTTLDSDMSKSISRISTILRQSVAMFFALAVLAFLAACGGGGGSDSSGVAITPSPAVIFEQEISQGVGAFGGTLSSGDQFGQTITSVGLLDGDVIPDLAVGAIADDDTGSSSGALWILFMNTDGTVKSEQKISGTAGGFTGSPSSSDFFGNPEAIGDLDGDGVPDLAVGSQGDDTGGFNHGAVYILFMNTDGTVKSHQKIADGVGGFAAGALGGGDQLGSSLANLGDLDGDGFIEVSVAACFDDDGAADQGAVYILSLNLDGTVRSRQKISATSGGFVGPTNGANLGCRGQTAVGDLDGDGVTDLAVGSVSDRDGGTFGLGAVWILFLNPDGTVKSEQKISATQGNFAGPLIDGDRFGDSITNMGDLDGDGVTDIAVGAFGDTNGTGATWVLFLNNDGTVKSSQKISNTEGGFGPGLLDVDDRFGEALGAVDLNGDGLVELAVGATHIQLGSPFGATGPGSVWILFFDPDSV